MTGNAVSEESPRAGKVSPPSVIPSASEGPHPRWWITQARSHNHRPLARFLTPKRGFRDDMRVVLGNGDRNLAFALSSRAQARDLTQADGSHRLAYTRSSSGCLADIPQRLFVHIQNRSVCGKRSDRGDVAAACDQRRSQTAATEPETYRETLQGF
jgi:hypothetical protein